jgi:hypothetical protein
MKESTHDDPRSMLDRMLTDQILPHAKRHVPHDIEAYLKSGAPEEVFIELRSVLEPVFAFFAGRSSKEERELLKRHAEDASQSLTFDGFLHFAQACGLLEHQFSTEMSTDFTIHELASLYVDAHPVQRVDRPGGISYKEFTQCLLQMTLLASDVLDVPVARRRTNSSSRYFARSRTNSSARKDSGGVVERNRSNTMPTPEQTELLKQNLLRFLLCISKNVTENQMKGGEGDIQSKARTGGSQDTKKFERIASELEQGADQVLHNLLVGGGGGGSVGTGSTLSAVEEEEETDSFDPTDASRPRTQSRTGFNATNFMSSLMSGGRKADADKAPAAPRFMKSPKVRGKKEPGPKKTRTSFLEWSSAKPGAEKAEKAPPVRGANGKKMSFFQVPSFGKREENVLHDKKKERSFLARSGAALARNAAATTTKKTALAPIATEAAPSNDVAKCRQQLVAVYELHAPNKIHTVDGLLRKYKGREKDLVRIVKRKYGAVQL